MKSVRHHTWTFVHVWCLTLFSMMKICTFYEGKYLKKILKLHRNNEVEALVDMDSENLEGLNESNSQIKNDC